MQAAELDALLVYLSPEIAQLCRAVVAKVSAVPGLSGSVKLGWRSVNFRHETAGHICAVFPQSDCVAVYFENGKMLEDPERLLEGDHLKKGRFLRLYPGQSVPETGTALLLAEAIALRR